MKKLSEVLHYYLPYKVDMTTAAKGRSAYITTIKRRLKKVEILTPDLYEVMIFLRRKPILRPLSSLTPEFFTDWNLDIIDQISISEVRDGFKLPEELTFRQASLCFEKHLDIFGLIESSQAIEKTI